MEQYKQEFINFMVESEVLKFGEFTLKSGRKSPFFMNAGAYVTGTQLRRLGDIAAEAFGELTYSRFAPELGGQRVLFAHGGARFFFQCASDFDTAAVAENALYLAENGGHGIGRKRKAALRVKIFGGLYKPDAARLKKVVVLRALASEFVGAGVDETDILFNELIAFSSVHRRVLL